MTADAHAALLAQLRRPGACGGHPDAAGLVQTHISSLLLALWLIPVAALLLSAGPENVFSQIGVFFSKMAVVTFGGAYAVLAYMAQQAVDGFGWLSAGEMADGLGLAETTPGPLILVLQFVAIGDKSLLKMVATFRKTAPFICFRVLRWC